MIRTLLTGALLPLLLAAAVPAQKLDLKFDALAAKAKEKTEIDLDGAMLRKLLQTDTGKKLDSGGLLSNLKAVTVRSYEFEKDGEYSDRDLEPLHKQLGAGSGWSRIMNVKDKNESTEIYTMNQGTDVTGLLVINAESDELNVVYLSGTIQLADLGALQELVHSSVEFDLKHVIEGAN